ncbi:DUF58 domain-containing protein [Vibrio sp.]|uniref:DUF58 domain-containing protein n=1 Tax=Vibrio viridaestus TaxID=2487322 RepID=A0A3N9TLA9_9VIBR|nr:DUF58 domain-containing protein [Vibrio viridaestus]MDC0610565.1 DUF58 domain-containing protein [Vibrio sp.]RQW65129.1 DUF58 domain-containing protein [Vibrio viridaestus]
MAPLDLPLYSNGVELTLEELLTYKQQSIAWMPPAKSLWSVMTGQHQSRRLGRGMDFAEVRQYQSGDDIRAIDWRVTARTGKPHTKLFTEEQQKPVVLFIDLSNSMQFGSTLMLKSVQAAHIASLIAWLSQANKDRIGAVVHLGEDERVLKPKGSTKGVLNLLQNLVELQTLALRNNQSQQSSIEQWNVSLSTLVKTVNKGSEVIIISDFTNYSPEQDIYFRRLKQHNVLRFVHISDPLEEGNTSFRGIETVTDYFQTRWLNFSADATRNGIKKSFDSHKDRLLLLCRKLGIPYTNLTTNTSLLKQLIGTL